MNPAGRVTSASAAGKSVVLLVLAAAQFMLVLDNSVANVALPRIQGALGFSESSLQYVVSLYALTFGGFLILAGRAADLFGRRRLFLLGLGMFTAASLVCGAATTPTMLLIARVVQGLGAAMASPAALSLVTTIFDEGPERNRALGIWGAVAAGGGAAGLILGGILTQTLGWRWVFFVNLPIGLLVVLAALRVIGESRDGGGRRLDVPGAVLVTAGLGLLVYGVTQGQQQGFGSGETLALLGAAVVALALFVIVELNVAEPLVPFSFFRRRGPAAANLIAIIQAAVIAGQSFFLTLYLQALLNYSPIQTGLAFVPLTVGAMLGAALASRAITRIGPRAILAVGMLLTAVDLVVLTTIRLTTSYWVLLPEFTVFGLGLGLAMVGTTITATNGVPPQEQGLASGLLNTSQQVGFAIGIAALVGVAVAGQIRSQDSVPAERVLDGYHVGFLVAGLLALIGLAASVLLIPGLRSRPGTTPQSAQPGPQTAGQAACAACGPSGRLVTTSLPVASGPVGRRDT